MAKTRGSKTASKSSDEPAQDEPQVKTLPPADSNPAKVFILPDGLSSEARIVTLNDPARGSPGRYLICPEKGPFDFTKVAAPKTDPRSWFLTPNGQQTSFRRKPDAKEERGATEGKDSPTEAYITKSQDLFIATPIDPLFLLIPIFSGQVSNQSSTNDMFRTIEDYLDDTGDQIAPKGSMLDMVTNCISQSEKFTSRIPAICDVLDTGMEKVYQFSIEKLSNEVFKKATRIAEKGLPPSLKHRFVTRPLEPPVMAIKTENSTVSTVITTMESEASTGASQASTGIDSTQVGSETTTVESQISTASTLATVEPDNATINVSVPSEVTRLSQIRTAITFILRSYVPVRLHNAILQHIASSSQIDFTPLNQHLEHIESMRAEVQALRSISDNITRKRAAEIDDEEAEKQAEKKRKKEEDERKRKNESKAIKDLKKTNTKGMMKLSSFFGKKPAMAKGKENAEA